MTEKIEKIIGQLLFMFYIMKTEIFILILQKYTLPIFQNTKTNYSFNYFKQSRMAVTKLSPLLRGIMSGHNSNFYCLNCFHLFRTKHKLKSHKRACRNKDFSSVEMSFVRS